MSLPINFDLRNLYVPSTSQRDYPDTHLDLLTLRDALNNFAGLFSLGFEIDSTNGNVSMGAPMPPGAKLDLRAAGGADTILRIGKGGSINTTLQAVAGALVIGVDGAGGYTERVRVTTAGVTITGNLTVTGTITPSGGSTGPSMRARSVTGTVIVLPDTPTRVTLDVEDWDTAAAFSSNRFQPTVAGYYQVNVAGNPGIACLYYVAQIAKNGVVYNTGGFAYDGTLLPDQRSTVSDIVFLNGSTDYIEMYCQSSAPQTTAPTTASMSIAYVRAP